MTFYTRLRLATGLRWRSHYPTMADLREFLRGLFAAFVLLAVFALTDHIDELGDRAAQIEQRAEAAERAAAIYEASAQVLRDCEQGAQGYYRAESGKTFECPRPL